jgi:hypothetical protein
MSRIVRGRRHFLTLSLLAILAPPRLVRAEPAHRQGELDVDVGLLYSTLPLELKGTMDEAVDRPAAGMRSPPAGGGGGWRAGSSRGARPAVVAGPHCTPARGSRLPVGSPVVS